MPPKRKRALLFDERGQPDDGLAEALRTEGLDVWQATDRPHLLAQSDLEPDLVMLAQERFDEATLDLCENIRRRAGQRSLIAIAIPTSDGAYVARFEDAGADEFLDCNLPTPLLRQRVRALLRSRDERDELLERLAQADSPRTRGPLPNPIQRGESCATPHSPAGSIPACGEDDAFLETLSRAAEDRAFHLAYQPKVTAHTGEFTGAEALLRWEDPTLGSVSPERFVPALEDLGLISDVGAWIVDEACRQSSAWRRSGLEPGKIALNVSPLQLRTPGLAEAIVAAARSNGTDPLHLQVEVTEGCLIEDPEDVARTLSTLRAHGVGICIDDFGTGFSSLQYLARLPLDFLKLDRAFVTPLETDAEARTLVVAIIAMAWNLGLRVIAEGVETRAQLEFLTDHGCDEIQGFYVSRPLAADRFAAWLRHAPAA